MRPLLPITAEAAAAQRTRQTGPRCAPGKPFGPGAASRSRNSLLEFRFSCPDRKRRELHSQAGPSAGIAGPWRTPLMSS
ncbi:hypothetical protein TVD_13525 [Thioalkalivibrio versutus]|uniref:Uncharacterized protein n=1 Tax=Thioalkalivibrio versutus TaxID=106634 RepID=A0A0G3G505_9GAMM|nr:hypothetical protein TVD_13525 [Thioalkalivibrio versutus]